jgi:MarR family transcriptional regulator, organic hydroperoxide resistance regulator
MNSSKWKPGVVKMNQEEQTGEQPREIWRAFWRVNSYLRKIAHKTATANQLSVPQFFILMAIGPLEATTQKKLGRTIRFPKSTLSQAVEGLVQAELLDRRPVENNRREMQLTLTEKGKAMYENILRHKNYAHAAFEAAVRTLSEKQQQELLDYLSRIESYLEKALLEQGEWSIDKNIEKSQGV